MKRLAPTAAVLAAAAAAALTGCSGSSAAADKPQLKVSGGYLPQPPMADMATGFFTVTNNGGTADQLTGVSSDLSPDVTIHTTNNGAMRQATSLPIPAGGRLVLSSGGNHLMLMNLRKRPAVGDQVSFELHFAKSGTITVKIPVEPPTYRPKG